MNEKARLQLQRQARRPARPTVSASPKAEPIDAVLSMQQSIGNQAVQRQLKGSGLPASLISATGARIGNHALQRLIQTKLTVGPPGDSYEREADRVANQVMQAPAASGPVQRAAAEHEGVEGEEEELQTKPLAKGIQRAAPEEEEEIKTKPLATTISRREVQRAGAEEEELQTKSMIQRAAPEEEELQKKPTIQRTSADEGFEASTNLENRLAGQKGGGSPLSDDVRSFMEPRFGTDFSDVKIHSGSDAGQMNREVQAQAFTLGQDIYMGEGKYNPGSSDGKRLLAHELTHVVQQAGAPSAQPKRTDETG
ncbi:MAG: DUF4157 domain-containing protein [Chloroflexota bacterium]